MAETAVRLEGAEMTRTPKTCPTDQTGPAVRHRRRGGELPQMAVADGTRDAVSPVTVTGAARPIRLPAR